ncbi:MAG: glycosyltransferase family 39 protein [Gemmataceae bacterium]
MSDRRFVCLLAGLAAGYLALAGTLPPLDDELYYWCWAQQLQLSYFDHPPMTALLIRASTTLFGDSVLALRLPACLTTLVMLAVVGHLVTRPRELLPLVICTPLFTFGAILITPDTPLLLFWSLYLLWLVKVQERLTPTDGGPAAYRRGCGRPAGRHSGGRYSASTPPGWRGRPGSSRSS